MAGDELGKVGVRTGDPEKERNKMHLDEKFKCHTAHTKRREERVNFARFLTAQVETIIITMGST